MENRIRNILVFDARLDPTEAEIWISVYPERLTSPTRISGRLVGPRCPYSSTVEVAYPLREHSREYETTGTPRIILRWIIPDPCLWEPQSPFLYEGVVELWHGDQRCDQRPLTCALRTLRLGARGVKLNGRPFTIQGTTGTELSEQDARALHQKNYNMLLLPATADAGLWNMAGQFGFFVIVRIANAPELKAHRARARDFQKHSCCLGWLVSGEAVADPLALIEVQGLVDEMRGQLLGMELPEAPSGTLPEKFSFVACQERLLPALEGIPVLLLRQAGSADGDVAREPEPAPGILGWIDL